MLRSIALTAGLLAALPAMAGEMGADEAHRFVIGKMFSYTCFEGTRGQGRVNPDGSVAGTVQFQGSGPVRYAHLPANTLQVRGESVCATLRGMLFQPCFNLERTGDNTFRGAISGLALPIASSRGTDGRRCAQLAPQPELAGWSAARLASFDRRRQ